MLKCQLLFTVVRLVGGSSYNEGRVEAYYNGEWGTICDSKWNNNKATMVCMQLGLGSLGIPSKFGPGTGKIFLNNILCSKNNTVIANCGHYGVGITLNCDHSKDVGVKCLSMSNI